MENSAATNLFDLLVTRDFDPELLDASGKAVSDPAEADLFSFEWKADDRNYGTVVILLGSENELEIYYGDNLGRTMEPEHKQAWYGFLEQMKQFASRNLLNFQLNNINRLKYTMKGIAAIREGLFEGYYGKRDISYSDQPKQTRLMIKHSRRLGEGEARYRAIENLFVETAEGERFKLPFRNLVGGRAMARHVAEGGTPYDAFGQHISQIIAEINTLGSFVRATRNRQYGAGAEQMVESAIRHYADLKAKARRMISQRGYREARDTFDPIQISDSEQAVNEIRDLFLEQSLDHRIEQALPVLSKLRTPMKEADEFESWANGLTEGTWALPDDEVQVERLRELMTEPLPVGVDATNATEQLYDLVGDDELFDQLELLAREDPDADARPLIQARLEDMGFDIGMTDNGEPDADQDDLDVEEDLDTDGTMMTRPSNMSSESADKALKDLRRLLIP